MDDGHHGERAASDRSLVPGGVYWALEHPSLALEFLSPGLSALKAGYIALWQSLSIRPERAAGVHSVARKIASFKDRYEGVQTTAGVAWYVIGLIHSKEASLRFDRHLHNGDPLTARTVHVPKGRPKTGNPPFTWEESALDALRLDGMEGISAWSVAMVAYRLEHFNGFGYRSQHPPINSPYLWAFTNQYTKGHYTSDGHYDPEAVDLDCGAMPLLRALIDIGAVDIPLDAET